MATIPSIGEIIQGSTRPIWTLTVKQSDNSALNLTGATFTGVLANLETGTIKTLTTGNFAISNAASGIFTYSPASADVNMPGQWMWETCITISSQTYYVWARAEVLARYAT